MSEQQKSNGMATAGFVLAFFIPLLGMIFSIIGLTKSKDSGKGKGLAIAGIVISLVVGLFQYSLIAGMGTAIDEATNDTTTKQEQSSDTTEQKDEKSLPKVGDKASDGDVEFVVKSIKCGETKVGSSFLEEKAQGEYCRVAVSIKNNGNDATMISSSDLKLIDDAGREFSADSTATLYASSDDAGNTWFDEINPGNTVKGDILFDVSKGANIVKAKFQAGLFSGGVEIDLKK